MTHPSAITLSRARSEGREIQNLLWGSL